MEKDYLLADAIYSFFRPEMFKHLCEDCASEPKNITKHLAISDAYLLTSLNTRNKPNMKDINAIEETTFVTIGYPPCWKDDRRLYFIRDSKEIDLPGK